MKDKAVLSDSPSASTMLSTPDNLASGSKAKRSKLRNVLKSASGSSPKKAKPPLPPKKAVAFSDTPEVAFQRQSCVGAILLPTPQQQLDTTSCDSCTDVLSEEGVTKEQRDFWSRIIRFLVNTLNSWIT